MKNTNKEVRALTEVKRCTTCGEREKVIEHEGHLIGQCPNNHYARFITMPKGIRIALG